MRDDSILYTGVTSHASRKVAEAKKERSSAKDEKKSKLKPAVQIVVDEIEREKESTIRTLLSTINPNTSEEDTKSLIVSLNLYSESLSRLKARINTIMREK